MLHTLGLLLLCLPSAQAQNADDFFHGGALSYLSNNIPGALEVVTNGLQRFPEDEKLKKLYELLNQKQQQQQQQQDQQNQEQKDQQNQQDQEQDQQKQDEPKQNDQQKQEQKNQQEAKDKKEQEKKDQARSGDQSKDKPEKGDPQQVAAHQMTPQEAKQLLDAQKDDEQVLIFQPQGEPKNKTRQLKDW
ncbi:MAG TPA: hypothetical protein VFZ59_08660 [Verrucomicrobiae bacterium]|nr:hypothetical protein [Verrucomicrobiae bacterium]